jgi:putative DNA-invertase from lambdoid prophage Rac
VIVWASAPRGRFRQFARQGSRVTFLSRGSPFSSASVYLCHATITGRFPLPESYWCGTTVLQMTRRKKPTADTALPRTFGYCRVSTNHQATEGHSLPDQKSRIAGYCQAQGLPAPTELFIDPGTSGTVSLQKREAGTRMLAQVRKGDHIIVTRGDRIFRSAKNALEIAEMLRDTGVELHLMDMGGPVLHSSVSRLVFGILMMVANMESERIGERVASVKEHLRNQGKFLGGAMAIGYTKGANNTLTVARDWRKQLAMMKALSAEGESTRAIAATMKARGLEISHNTVFRVLDQRRKTDAVVSTA